MSNTKMRSAIIALSSSITSLDKNKNPPHLPVNPTPQLPTQEKNSHNKQHRGLTPSKILVSYYINTLKNHKLVNPCLYKTISTFRSEEIKHRVV